MPYFRLLSDSRDTFELPHHDESLQRVPLDHCTKKHEFTLLNKGITGVWVTGAGVSGVRVTILWLVVLGLLVTSARVNCFRVADARLLVHQQMTVDKQ